MKGTIKKLLSAKHCGFIRGDDEKEYFFHSSALKNTRYEDLQEGDTITKFEISPGVGGKGPRAEHIYV